MPLALPQHRRTLPNATLKSNKTGACSRFVKGKKKRRTGKQRARQSSSAKHRATGKKKNRGKQGTDRGARRKRIRRIGKEERKKTQCRRVRRSRSALQREVSLSKIRKERERKRREREKKRQEVEEDSSGTGDDGGQKTNKTEAREPDSSSLPRLTLPRPASSCLASACQLATRRQTHPSLSFVLMPTRLHASSVFPVVVSFFYPRQSNSCPRSSLSPPRRTSFLAASVSFFVAALSQKSFRSDLSTLFASCVEDSMEIHRPTATF